MTTVRRYWLLTSARKERSVMELPFGPPRPPGPWQDSQYVLNTDAPWVGTPGDFARLRYEGGLDPWRIPGLLHRDRIPLTITSICLSVSIPPALCANAGIAVPGTPLSMTLRIEASSA